MRRRWKKIGLSAPWLLFIHEIFRAGFTWKSWLSVWVLLAVFLCFFCLDIISNTLNFLLYSTRYRYLNVLANLYIASGGDKQPGVPPAAPHQHAGRSGTFHRLWGRQRGILHTSQHPHVNQYCLNLFFAFCDKFYEMFTSVPDDPLQLLPILMSLGACSVTLRQRAGKILLDH